MRPSPLGVGVREDLRSTKMASFLFFSFTRPLVVRPEQFFHGHRFVDMVFGSGDLLIGDQEPHVGIHQILGFQIVRVIWSRNSALDIEHRANQAVPEEPKLQERPRAVRRSG